MGFNTTLILMNDALEQIRDDKNLGRKLADAVLKVSLGKAVDVNAGNHCNAITVLESHHADQYNMVAVGGNYAIDFGHVYPQYRVSEFNDNGDVQKLAIIRAMADTMGYTLTKKGSK